MATLREYFDADFPNTVTITSSIPLTIQDVGEIVVDAHVHFDFAAKALFTSFYIEQTHLSVAQLTEMINQLHHLVSTNWPHPSNTRLPRPRLMPGSISVSTYPYQFAFEFFGGPATRHDQLLNTGRMYFYIDMDLTHEQQDEIRRSAQNAAVDPQFRGKIYRQELDNWQTPVAFISHDSRDKELIARPIALGLQKELVPVWYDEFSLSIGSKLRESIEAGIKDCRKCILVVTKNFLSNSGWTKVEFDNVFAKDLFEKRNVLLPVWQEVSWREVYEYSPWLANIKAIQWDEGEDKVVKQLLGEIMKE